MKILRLVALSLALTCFAVAEDTARIQFKKFASGDFKPLGLGPYSGWSMHSEDGKKYRRAFLNKQVEGVERIGIEAVPVAIENLSHPHRHIRYIAAESLRRITGRRPTWYNFGVPGETFNGNKTWSEDATEEWQLWYDAKKKQNKSEMATPRKPSD